MHYYHNLDIQDASDFIYNSLALTKEPSEAGANLILFCDVHFIFELVKFMDTKKRVLFLIMKTDFSLSNYTPSEINILKNLRIQALIPLERISILN